MQRFYFILVLVSLCFLSACQPKGPQEKSKGDSVIQAPTVVVVNYPLEFIVESLAGTEVKVLNPVPLGDDPETWFPDDAMIQTIQKADLIITNGAGFSAWVKKLSLPRSKILRTSLFLKESLITVPDFDVHSHGAGGAHSHAGTVAFFWLDPALFARQADVIGERLAKLLPSKKESISSNLKTLKKSLEPLNEKLDQLRLKYPGLYCFTQRPVYQYLTRRIDWTVHHLHLKKNEEPDETTWSKLKAIQDENKVPFMIWEQNPSAKTIKELEQHGVSSVVLNPLGAKPAEGDFLTEMGRQLDKLETFLEKQNSKKDSAQAK